MNASLGLHCMKADSIKRSSRRTISQHLLLLGLVTQLSVVHGQELPSGIVTLHDAPSVGSASISIVNFGSDTPAFANRMNQKAGGFLCGRGFCTAPYVNAHALTSIDGKILAAEQDPDSGSTFLGIFQPDFKFERLPAPIGFPNIEAMAWTGSKLLAASVDFAAGTSQLIEINRTTGEATLAGVPEINAVITGLAWDPDGSNLYAASIPTEGSTLPAPGLHRIDLNSGETTLRGIIGQEVQGLAWMPPLGLIGVWDKVYTIDILTAAPVPLVTGPEFVVTNGSGVFGLAALGELAIPESPGPMDEPNPLFPDSTVSVMDDVVNVSWEANVNTFYEIEYSPSLHHWNWKLIDTLNIAEEGRANCGANIILPPGGSGPVSVDHPYNPNIKQGFYRVRATEFEATATNDPLRLLLAAVFGFGAIGISTLRQKRRVPMA